jgi:hypothetical protein
MSTLYVKAQTLLQAMKDERGQDLTGSPCSPLSFLSPVSLAMTPLAIENKKHFNSVVSAM